MLNPQPHDRILDIGCNQGYFERHFLIGKVAEVHGVDYDEAAIEYAKRMDGDQYYTRCDSAKLPFDDNSFDKILCLDTFEHVGDEGATVSEIRRVLKPGGLLVLSVPHRFLDALDGNNFRHNFPWLVHAWRRFRGKTPLDIRSLYKHRHYSAEDLQEHFHQFDVSKVHRTAPLSRPIGWMIWAGRTERVRAAIRRMTGWLQDLDYKFNWGFGFAIIMSARNEPAFSHAVQPVSQVAEGLRREDLAAGRI